MWSWLKQLFKWEFYTEKKISKLHTLTHTLSKKSNCLNRGCFTGLHRLIFECNDTKTSVCFAIFGNVICIISQLLFYSSVICNFFCLWLWGYFIYVTHLKLFFTRLPQLGNTNKLLGNGLLFWLLFKNVLFTPCLQ